MERTTVSCKEHLTRKAMALPTSTSSKSPEGAQERRVGGKFHTGLICSPPSCMRGCSYWDILLNRKFQFRIFQVGGETILVVGGNFSIYKDGQFLCCI